MATKIVIPGVIKVAQEPRLRCHTCGCVFSYEQSDVTYDADVRISPFVRCPQEGCKELVLVTRKFHEADPEVAAAVKAGFNSVRPKDA